MDVDSRLGSIQITSFDEDEEGDAGNDVVEDEVSTDEEDDQEPVTLGFAEKPEKSWTLKRQYFPSKAGGTPAWLDPVNLPSGKCSLCDFCGQPLQFLLQVYAPLSQESAFHRTLFIFMCTSMTCLLRDQHEQWKRYPETPLRSVKVFRCQLPRMNSFYSPERPNDDGTTLPLSAAGILCKWCGTWIGDKVCAGCKKTNYCSPAHQTAHWKSHKLSHKVACRQLETPSHGSESGICDSLWPEYELAIEDEPERDAEPHDNASSNSLISSKADHSFKSSESYFKGHVDNKSWASFHERISVAPDQVLRYSDSPHSKPLWPVSSGRPSRYDIPKCIFCGGARRFEFQVLPQLLYFFHVEDDADNSLDWATIAVYTCESSCEAQLSYKEEFAWVQLDTSSMSHK